MTTIFRTRNSLMLILIATLTLLLVFAPSMLQSQTSKSVAATATIQQLETRIKKLERQLKSAELSTIRYLTVGDSSGTFGGICPNIENLENRPGGDIGRLMPRVDIYGNEILDIRGKAVSRYVYQCAVPVLVLNRNR